MIAYLNGIFSGIRMHLFLSPPDAKNRTRILLDHLESAVYKCLFNSQILQTTEFRHEVFDFAEAQFDMLHLHFKINRIAYKDIDERIVDVLCKLIKTRDSSGIYHLQEMLIPRNGQQKLSSRGRKSEVISVKSLNILTIPVDEDHPSCSRRYL